MFLYSKNTTVGKPAPNYSDLSEYQIAEGQLIKGFQIGPIGNDVIFLTGTKAQQDMFVWNSNTDTLDQLNADPIPSNIESFNSRNLRTMAKSFVDEENNVYFESGNYLTKISSKREITVYRNLPRFLNTPEEISTKSVSTLYKKIIEKYSKEQLVGLKMYNSPVVAYLIEIDGMHYYNQYNLDKKPGDYTLSRFVLEGEINKNKQVTKTVLIKPRLMEGKEPLASNIPHPLDYKMHRIENNPFKATIQRVCYKELLPGDRPCKGRRTLLTIGRSKYVLPNFEVGGEMDAGLFYAPYDNRYFTSNGKFIFLSQDNTLYAIPSGKPEVSCRYSDRMKRVIAFKYIYT